MYLKLEYACLCPPAHSLWKSILHRYCDPHYRMMLTDNQQVSAKEALYNLAFKMHGFTEDRENEEFGSVSLSPTDCDDDQLIFE